MIKSFFYTKEWWILSWGGLFVLNISLWIQVNLTVAINTWYGGFYDLLQNAGDYKDNKIIRDPNHDHTNHFFNLKTLNIVYFIKLSAYDFLIIFFSLGSINSNVNLFFFAYLIAFSLVENSNFTSESVCVELSHPIKGLIPVFLSMYSKIQFLVLPIPDCIDVLDGLYIFTLFIS